MRGEDSQRHRRRHGSQAGPRPMENITGGWWWRCSPLVLTSPRPSATSRLRGTAGAPARLADHPPRAPLASRDGGYTRPTRAPPVVCDTGSSRRSRREAQAGNSTAPSPLRQGLGTRVHFKCKEQRAALATAHIHHHPPTPPPTPIPSPTPLPLFPGHGPRARRPRRPGRAARDGRHCQMLDRASALLRQHQLCVCPAQSTRSFGARRATARCVRAL